jgi:hypothetical protein
VRTVISASRRTDLVASFPEWLAAALEAGTARVVGPSGRARDVDLAPGSVHTIVLWSKDYENLLKDAAGLGRLLHAYDQVYCHFTITGLGGTPVEPGSPEPEAALSQIPALVRFAGRPERVSLRFDPLVFWRERSALRSNLGFFDRLAAAAAASGIPTIRMSFAQWYRKAVRRAAAWGFRYVDPPDEEKQALAASLTAKARRAGLPAVSDGRSRRPPAVLLRRWTAAPGAAPARRARVGAEGPDAARGMSVHGVRRDRELHAGLPPRLRVLLCQSVGGVRPPKRRDLRRGLRCPGSAARPAREEVSRRGSFSWLPRYHNRPGRT